MKIKDAINMANLMENGNVMPKELAILFLSELDGMIQSDIMLYAPEEIVSYTDEEQELILRPPHDKLYVHYLVMMIRNQQQEYEGYQNSQESVNEKLKTFRRWYVQHYRPADTGSRSYTGGTSADAFGFAYLTAYGLAVKHGYQGTEEEWLESLHGEKGDDGTPARMRYDPEREMIQWGVGDAWYDLFTLAELRDPAVAAFLAEAQASAEAAVQAAQDAKAAQHNAARLADNVEGLEANAKASAQSAAESAAGAAASLQAASAGAQAAAGSAGRAQELAGVASDAAQSAAVSADRAEAAAQRAEEAAASGGSGGGGIAEETDPTVPEWAKQPNKPTYTAEEVGADPAGTASSVMGGHNVERFAHEDIRLELRTLADRVSAALNSSDETLDQLSEIVDYIKSNKSLIEAITTSKVSVADIVDNLVTNVSNKPLSAARGVALKQLIDGLASGKLDASRLQEAIDTALAQAKASGEFDGPQGEPGVSGVYTLGDGETLEDVPADADVVIDPGGVPTTETWVFTLADGTTVERTVYLA